MEKEYTYEGQKHFEIIFETGERRAICNPKQIKKPSKLTDDWEKVTCGNCLNKKNKKEITENIKNPAEKREYLPDKDYNKIMKLKEQLDKIPDDEN